MLTVQYPLAVKFIAAFIYQRDAPYGKAKDILAKKYGPIDFESEEIGFTFTDYYRNEMGDNLARRFIGFKKLRDPAGFVAIKRFALRIEKRFAKASQRTINIDPGYINEAKLVLTTTKDFSHRIYLGDGVFGEVTLMYQNGQFQDLPSTFPDYRTELYKGIFQKIRDQYQEQLEK